MVTSTLETVMQTARAVMASLALSYEVDSGTPQNIDEDDIEEQKRIAREREQRIIAGLK